MSVCMCSCVCAGTHACVCVHTWSQRQVSGVFLNLFPLYFLRQDLSRDLLLTDLTGLNWLTRGWTWSRYTEWNSQRTNKKMRGKPFRSSGCVTRWALWWLNHLPSPSSRDPSWSKHQGHQVQICRYLFPHAGAEAPSLQQAGYGVSLSLNLISLSF